MTLLKNALGKPTVRSYHRPTRHPKSRALTAPNAGKVWSYRNAHSVLVSLQRGAATVVEKWTASYETQHTHTARPSILLLGVCRPKELKTRPHKTCTGRIFNGKKSLQQVVLGELDSSVCISDIQAHPLPIQNTLKMA